MEYLISIVLIIGIVGGSFYLVYSTIKKISFAFSKKEIFCKACGTISNPINSTPGSIFLELLLWLLGGLPGLIYSIWRLSNKIKICPACKSKDVIPSDSPFAKKAS